MSRLIRPEKLHLSNGIPVILQNHDGPVAATYWWNRVGSADEVGPEAGFAHFLEHMLFKDAAAKETGVPSSGRMARTIESLGGEINAYTSFDQTVYHVTCAEQHWERVLETFGGMARPQRFLKTDFVREREVILEELRKNEDSPGRQLFQKLFTLTYLKHPYGRPVIGFTRTLKAATLARLESFYRKHYVTENMGIVLVGPIGDLAGPRRKKILRTLEKYFGASVLKKSTGYRRPSRPSEPSLRPGPQWDALPFDVQSPTLAVSFRVPALRHDDIPALDLISGILGMGEVSRLYQQLFYKESLVTEVSGGLYVPRDAGMLYFQAEFEETGKVGAVAGKMFETVRSIIDEPPEPHELARVITNIESERLYASQTADGLAGRVGFLEFTLGDLAYDQEYVERLNLVTPEKISEVASRYLDHRRMSGVVMAPKTEAKQVSLPKLVAESKRAFRPAGTNRGGRKGSPVNGVGIHQRTEYAAPVPVAEYFQRPSGIQVVYFFRPLSHAFSIHASALGGLRLELGAGDRYWGASHLLSSTWAKGCEGRTARDIATLVEGHAAHLDGFSGRNSLGLEVTGLERDWRTLSGLFTECLTRPAFSEEELEHSKRVTEDSIRSIEESSAQLCTRQFLETLYEKHPYQRLTLGSLETVRNLTSEDMHRFHRAWIRPERIVLSVVGNVHRLELEEWLDELEERLAKSSSGTSDLKFSVESLSDESLLKGPRWAERALSREQAHLLIGGLGVRLTDADRYPLRLINTLLGGQGGRLFVELREKKSLAYTVSPIGFEGLERGYLGTYMASSPSKKEEAIAGIRAVYEKLAAKGPSIGEMKRAQEFYLGRRAMELQSDGSFATYYGLKVLYGGRPADDLGLSERIRKITARDIQRVCRRYYLDAHLVTSIVG